MSTSYKVVGHAVAEWDDESPLKWTMRETKNRGADQRAERYDFDLTPLRGGYDAQFLLELKSLLMARRKRVSLLTIQSIFANTRKLLRDVQDRQLLDEPVTQIDEPFLLALRTALENIPYTYLTTLKRLFTEYRDSKLFAPDLLPEDFPVRRSKKGLVGDLTTRILSKALSRAACVAVLRAVEDAYEAKTIDIGTFSFCHLVFHAYCRPESYRRITVSDLRIDTDPQTESKSYFLFVMPAKSGVHAPRKIAYRLNAFVGKLVEAQRAAVIQQYGHLVDRSEVGRLALFPSRRMRADGNWLYPHSQEHHGELQGSDSLTTSYLKPIRRLQQKVSFDFNALRHTVGTQMAATGCSAQTIQAVLKHVNHTTCQTYVDIAFAGLIDRLSDTLKPGFEEHFPAFEHFRSKEEPIELKKAIRSEDIDTGRSELTGECGRTIACQYAPLACYECARFIPCYDADHSINLDQVDREIQEYEARGLPFRNLVERSKHIRNHIKLVMMVADQKRHALSQGAQHEHPCRP